MYGCPRVFLQFPTCSCDFQVGDRLGWLVLSSAVLYLFQNKKGAPKRIASAPYSDIREEEGGRGQRKGTRVRDMSELNGEPSKISRRKTKPIVSSSQIAHLQRVTPPLERSGNSTDRCDHLCKILVSIYLREFTIPVMRCKTQYKFDVVGLALRCKARD